VITRRAAADRGHFDFGWLDTWHTFSFGEYYDPRHMGFRTLRVINEDRVQPGRGFPTHGHRDMEIISYVLEGALQHRDSLGNGSVIRPGEIQRMSAGTGVTHSEFNASQDALVHFLQIWILPERVGLAPGYEQRAFPRVERRGRLRCVVSRDGHDGSVGIHQDAEIFVAELAKAERLVHRLRPGRHAWVQVARGAVRLGEERLAAGDGAAVSDESQCELTGIDAAELLLFDLA
jgi:redox-sensitive bicupin YhaK (pirin superfamily)